MKICKKGLYLGADGAQLAQLCGLICHEGVFSHSSMSCCKPAAAIWRAGGKSRRRDESVMQWHYAASVPRSDPPGIAEGRRTLRFARF